jgi:hypothetical protein
MSQSAPPPRPPAPAGHDAAAMAAGTAVLSLVRAARSFTLYDPANKVVRQLIGDYKEKVRATLDTYGPVRLLVHPFELMLGTEQVYLEKDRERSLAFRLFRDGVREITLLPSVTWEELLRLLEVLSVRFTGVRQQEDDLVTLLRKAEFRGITIAAIEGYAPEEEQAEPQGGDGGPSVANARFAAPGAWDTPLPQFSEGVPLRFRALDQGVLERLRAEETPESLPDQGVRAALELLEAATDPADKETAVAFSREVNEYLLVEGRADLVAQLAPKVGADEGSGGAPAATLRALLLAQPAGTQDLPRDLAAMVDGAGDEAVTTVLDLVAAEGDGPRLPFLLSVGARVVGGSADSAQARLAEVSEQHKGALLQVLGELDPPRALAGFLDCVETGGPSVQEQALILAARVRPGPAHLRLLRRLLNAGTDTVRRRAIRLLPKVGGPRAFPVLEAFSQEHAATASNDDVVDLGQALVDSDRKAAMELFRTWVHASEGLLGRLKGGSASSALQRMALAGLEKAGGEDSRGLLQQVASKGDPALRAQAAAILQGRTASSAPSGGAQHG